MQQSIHYYKENKKILRDVSTSIKEGQITKWINKKIERKYVKPTNIQQHEVITITQN